MTNRQQLLLARKEAGRVGEPAALLDLVDMATVLLDEGFASAVVAESLNWPTQGNVTREDRMREALDIANAWPPDALLLARRYRADWHALREPARWWRGRKVERQEVVLFAVGFVEAHGRWPSVDELRRRFGFTSGHLAPGEGDERQDALLNPEALS